MGVHAEGTAPFAAHGAPPHTFVTADGMCGRVGGNVVLKIAYSTVGQTGSLKQHTDLRAKAFSPSNIIGKQRDRSVARSKRSARTSFSYHTFKAKMFLTLVSIAISMENTLASGSVALTDATFSTAISSCLGESEAAAMGGLCTSYGVTSGFGTMPDWNTGLVTNMKRAFFNKNNFNVPIGNWNTSQVTDMSGMFESASEFNQDISSWSVASVVNMESMFSSASSFNQNITGWALADSLTSTDMFLSTTAWLETFARTDGQDTTDGPPSMWNEPCGNGWYDANFQEECEPRVNGIEVKGCADDCKVQTNWKCENVESLRPGDDFDSYNCTCDNPGGTYASPDLDCARTDCIYADRCLAYGLGCAPGAGGNACDRCLTAADIAELPLNERSRFSKNGYYKTG